MRGRVERKPLGHFEVRRNERVVRGELARYRRHRARARTPLYVYDARTIDRAIEELRSLPVDTREGDLILIACAGAYGFAMASRYNLREPAPWRTQSLLFQPGIA